MSLSSLSPKPPPYTPLLVSNYQSETLSSLSFSSCSQHRLGYCFQSITRPSGRSDQWTHRQFTFRTFRTWTLDSTLERILLSAMRQLMTGHPPLLSVAVRFDWYLCYLADFCLRSPPVAGGAHFSIQKKLWELVSLGDILISMTVLKIAWTLI